MSSDVEGLLKTVTVRELARLTGIAQWRVYQLLSKGAAPPHFRIGRTVRFRVHDVEKWLEDKTHHQNG